MDKPSRKMFPGKTEKELTSEQMSALNTEFELHLLDTVLTKWERELSDLNEQKKKLKAEIDSEKDYDRQREKEREMKSLESNIKIKKNTINDFSKIRNKLNEKKGINRFGRLVNQSLNKLKEY